MLFETRREDRSFVFLATTVFTMSIFVSLGDFVWFQTASFHLGIVNILGIVLFIIGITIRWIGKRTLGRYYAYGLRILPDHKLVKHGIYRRIRHPITSAAMMYSIGIPLILSSLLGLIIMLGLVPLFIYRTRIEERMLIERFGDEYLEYVKKTKKFIPFIY